MTASLKALPSFTEALFKSVDGGYVTQFTFAGQTSKRRDPMEDAFEYFGQETVDILRTKPPPAAIDQDFIAAFQKWTSEPPKFSAKALEVLLGFSANGSSVIAPAMRDALRSETFNVLPDDLKTIFLPLANSTIGQWILSDRTTDFQPEEKQAVLDMIDIHIQHGADKHDALVYFASIAVAFPDEFAEYSQRLRSFLPPVERLKQDQAEWQNFTSFIQAAIPPKVSADFAAAIPEYRDFFIPNADIETDPPEPA